MRKRRILTSAVVLSAAVATSLVSPPGAWAAGWTDTTATVGVPFTSPAADTTDMPVPCTDPVYSSTDLPSNGLSLNADGTVSGTPSAATTVSGSITGTCTETTTWSFTFSITISLQTRALTWTPTNLSFTTTQTPWTPDATASTVSGTGAISYAVTGANSAGCTVTSGTGVISAVTGAGTCDVIATIASDGTYEQVSSSPVTFTVSRSSQSVTWSPTNRNVQTTASPLTPNVLASTTGDGAITYAVTNAGTTNCSVNPTTAVLTFTSAGTCQVTATAAQTAVYSEGASTPVSFTITAPSGGGGGSSDTSGGSTTTPTTPGSTPTNPITAPGVPTTAPTAPNGPSNPPNGRTSQVIGPGVTLVSRTVALVATPRFFKSKAATSLAKAPVTVRTVNGVKEPIYRVRQLVRLVVRVPASTLLDLRIKIGKRYYAMGKGLSDSRGLLSLPVFGATRAVTYPVAMVDAKRGVTYYVKIKIGPAL